MHMHGLPLFKFTIDRMAEGAGGAAGCRASACGAMRGLGTPLGQPPRTWGQAFGAHTGQKEPCCLCFCAASSSIPWVDLEGDANAGAGTDDYINSAAAHVHTSRELADNLLQMTSR